MEKPIPYDGNKPFIFISYSHRDSDIVWPIIGQMIKNGYRVWYDDGIDPGTEWDEFIATKIAECGYFIGFISDNYVASDNCKDELNFARDQVENRLLVYIKDTSLPKGMEMRLGRIQAIHWYTFKNEKQFFSKLYSSKNLYSFRDAPEIASAPAPVPAPVPAPAPVVEPVVTEPEPVPEENLIPEPKVEPVSEEKQEVIPETSEDMAPSDIPSEVISENESVEAPILAPAEDIPAEPVKEEVKKEKKEKKPKAPKKEKEPKEEKPKDVSDENSSKKFEMPEGAWKRWGIPGFRSGNKLHMALGIVALLIVAVVLYFSIWAIIDGINWYDVEEWSLGVIATIIAVLDYLVISNYAYIQDRLFKLYKLNKIWRYLIVAFIAVVMTIVIFFGGVVVMTITGAV